MTLEEKVDSVLQKLDRLEAIESHLLDLLLPQRKAFMRTPQPLPVPAVSDQLSEIVSHIKALHVQVDGLGLTEPPDPKNSPIKKARKK